MASFFTWFLLAFLVSPSLIKDDSLFCSGGDDDDDDDGDAPTDGFTAVPLTEENFEIQRPYNLPVGARYSFIDGVRSLWVYSTDEPHFPASATRPRTEIHGYTYSSDVWQFEGDAYVPQGTTGVCIMQIFGAGAGGRASTLMLRVYDGALRYYKRQLIEDDIYNRWFRVNVTHDVDAREVAVSINGVLKLTVGDQGGNQHYFKFGVYEQNESSNYMESRWKGVKLYKKSYQEKTMIDVKV